MCSTRLHVLKKQHSTRRTAKSVELGKYKERCGLSVEDAFL